MSEQGFRGVPGVPEGWELVEVRPISEDWTIGSDGKPMFYEGALTTTWWPVIRKIEQAPKYRPFESAAEYVANRLERFAVDWKTQTDLAPGFFAVVSANEMFVWVAFGDAIEKLDWEEAFESLQFRHVDNSTSPFGIEVTE